MSVIQYQINRKTHKVFISKEIINILIKDVVSLKSDRKIMFIYDENIDNKIVKNYLDELKTTGCKIFTSKVNGGRDNKNVNFLLKVIDSLSNNKFTKKSILISFGGGVVGDVCGLVASLYMRGLIYFHIPSTMMAILDSCIGGKNAINYKNRINLIGTYYHPLRIYIANSVIAKIPEREFFSGLSEAIKCGIIHNNKILTILKKNKKLIYSRNFSMLEILINLVLKTKLYFFLKDINENNKRLFLNFGHTFAHAIESAVDKFYKNFKLNHGEAVAIGILSEMKYANVKNSFVKEIEDLFKSYNLPNELHLPNKKNLPIFQKEVFKNLFLDKKKDSRYPKYIHIVKQGKPSIRLLDNSAAIDEIINQLIF
jgi:3-dehydroquinate synthase